MRKLLVMGLLVLASTGSTGCVLVGPGNTQIKLNGSIIGEMHAQSGGLNGYLVTLYPNVTDAIQTVNDVTCHGNEVCTLRWMRGFNNNGYWRSATADDEAGDFAEALNATRGNNRCVAVHVKNSGENWTYRDPTDASCRR